MGAREQAWALELTGGSCREGRVWRQWAIRHSHVDLSPPHWVGANEGVSVLLGLSDWLRVLSLLDEQRGGCGGVTLGPSGAW